jgi:hypothetical protein
MDGILSTLKFLAVFFIPPPHPPENEGLLPHLGHACCFQIITVHYSAIIHAFDGMQLHPASAIKQTHTHSKWMQQ